METFAQPLPAYTALAAVGIVLFGAFLRVTRLTAGWVVLRSAAASVKLRRSATALKIRRRCTLTAESILRT